MSELNQLSKSIRKVRWQRRRNFATKTILILVVVLVFFRGWTVYGSHFFNKISNSDLMIGAEVKGVADVSFANGKFEADKLLSKFNSMSLSYIPVKKEGIVDLVIPNAHASIIMDVDSGTILHYNKGKEERQVASLTKIMTAVVVMDYIENLNELVKITEESVYIEGTKIGCPRSGYCIGNRLKVGEKISVKSLLKAMLMNSANDAATALAIHIAGSEKKFAKLMNAKAEELGLESSNFCRPSGLDLDGREKECYSSAYDIARIAAYSMRYQIIWDIFKTPNTKIFSVDGKIEHELLNTNKLLGEMPNCLGTKTGFTPLAGKSLMMAAEDKTRKHKIIIVILDNPYRWQDARIMSNWAFASYEWQ